MYYINDKRLNPNPITKFLVVVLLGFTVLHSINHYLEAAVVLAISIMYLINGFRREAIKNILVFGVLFFVPSFSALAKLPIFYNDDPFITCYISYVLSSFCSR